VQTAASRPTKQKKRKKKYAPDKQKKGEKKTEKKTCTTNKQKKGEKKKERCTTNTKKYAERSLAVRAGSVRPRGLAGIAKSMHLNRPKNRSKTCCRVIKHVPKPKERGKKEQKRGSGGPKSTA
jgi:hypothetical protein